MRSAFVGLIFLVKHLGRCSAATRPREAQGFQFGGNQQFGGNAPAPSPPPTFTSSPTSGFGGEDEGGANDYYSYYDDETPTVSPYPTTSPYPTATYAPVSGAGYVPVPVPVPAPVPGEYSPTPAQPGDVPVPPPSGIVQTLSPGSMPSIAGSSTVAPVNPGEINPDIPATVVPTNTTGELPEPGYPTPATPAYPGYPTPATPAYPTPDMSAAPVSVVPVTPASPVVPTPEYNNDDDFVPTVSPYPTVADGPENYPEPNPYPAPNPYPSPNSYPDWSFTPQPTRTYVSPDNDILDPGEDDKIQKEWEEKTTLEKAEAEWDEISHDKNVKIVSIVFGVTGFLLLIFVAHQLIENPDGFFGKLCRCVLACVRILCWPVRAVCCRSSRARDRRTHQLVASEYSHDLELT